MSQQAKYLPSFMRFEIVLVFLVLSVRVVSLLLDGPIETPDSASYLPQTNASLQSTLNWANLSSAGPRPFPVLFAYALLGSDMNRILFQIGFSTLAWWSVYRLFLGALAENRLQVAIAQSVTLLLAMHPRIVQQDCQLTSESITLSLALISFVLVMNWIMGHPQSRFRIIVLLLAPSLVAIQRYSIWTYSIVLVLASVIALKVLRRHILEGLFPRSKMRTLAAILVLATFFGLASGMRTANRDAQVAFDRGTGGYIGGVISYQILRDRPFAPAWRQFLIAQGAPPCADLSGQLVTPTFGVCVEAERWVKGPGRTAFLLSPVLAPVAFWGSVLSLLPNDISANPVPHRETSDWSIESWSYTRLLGLESNAILAFFVAILPAVILAGSTILALLRWRKFPVSQLTPFLIASYLASLIYFLLLNLVMPFDAWRHAIPVNVLLILSATALAVQSRRNSLATNKAVSR